MAKRDRIPLPKSIMDAEAAVAAQEAAEAAHRQSMQTAQPGQSGTVDGQPSGEGIVLVDPNAVSEPEKAPETVATPPADDALDKAQKEIAELKQQLEVFRVEHKTAQDQASYFKQRWDSLAGIHKAQVDDVRAQNQMLTARVNELEQALKDAPQTDTDMAEVRKMLGEKADQYSQEALETMALSRRISREGSGREVSELRQQLAKLQAAGTQNKTTGFWERVEAARPGFMSAREDFNTGYSMWFEDVNPKSADGYTYQQCMDLYAKLGNVEGALSLLDEFARVSGHKFGQGAAARETPIDAPPLHAKPQPGQSAPPSTKPIPTAPPKPRFPLAFATELTAHWAREGSRQGFRSFTVNTGGKSLTVTSRTQANKLCDECEEAIAEGRTY